MELLMNDVKPYVYKCSNEFCKQILYPIRRLISNIRYREILLQKHYVSQFPCYDVEYINTYIDSDRVLIVRMFYGLLSPTEAMELKNYAYIAKDNCKLEMKLWWQVIYDSARFACIAHEKEK